MKSKMIQKNCQKDYCKKKQMLKWNWKELQMSLKS